MLRKFDGLGLPEQLKPAHLLQSIQRAGTRLRKNLGAPWRYNTQPQRCKKRKHVEEAAAGGQFSASAPTVAMLEPAVRLPSEVLPDQLSNADAMALFEAAQVAGGNKLASFRHFVNARQRQQVSGEKREVERLYRRAAALHAGEIKFKLTLPFVLPAARPPFTRPTPGSLAAIRRAGRRGGGEVIRLGQGGHGLLSQHGGCSERSAPPPLAIASTRFASPLLWFYSDLR